MTLGEPAWDVSIHAPVRGATAGWSDIGLIRSHVSIHAPVTGRDVVSLRNLPHGLGFQSTRPYGARFGLVCRCDRLMVVSIHAPVRGATPPFACGRCSNSFNPRARTGREGSAGKRLGSFRFNPRARTGRDSY